MRFFTSLPNLAARNSRAGGEPQSSERRRKGLLRRAFADLCRASTAISPTGAQRSIAPILKPGNRPPDRANIAEISSPPCPAALLMLQPVC